MCKGEKKFLENTVLLFCKDEEALAEFRELKSAYAAFYTAQIYKRLALDERTVSPVGQVASKVKTYFLQKPMLRIRIRIHRIHMFLGLLDPDPDPLVRGMDPDHSIIKQK